MSIFTEKKNLLFLLNLITAKLLMLYLDIHSDFSKETPETN